MGSSIAWFSTYMRRTAGSARVSRLSFRFLWLYFFRFCICYNKKDAIRIFVGNMSVSKYWHNPAWQKKFDWKRREIKFWSFNCTKSHRVFLCSRDNIKYQFANIYIMANLDSTIKFPFCLSFIEAKLFTRYSLFFTFYALLVTFYSLLGKFY